MRSASPEADPMGLAGGDPASGAPPRWDPERLGALLEALRPRLRAVALRYTRDADAAQDVIQSAFEKAIRHREQFRGGALPSTWMHRIVVNEALMWLRTEKRRGRHLAWLEDLDRLPVADPSETAPERLERRGEVERLRRALGALEAEERLVIERCALEGCSYRRFGAEAGLHPSAAKSRAFRARRRLSELLSTRDAPTPCHRAAARSAGVQRSTSRPRVRLR